LGALVVIIRIIHRKLQIPGLELEVVRENTWFADREDRKRMAIVISLNLINRSGRAITIKSCKMSGYSPKEEPDPVILKGKEGEIVLDFPPYEHFYAGKEIQVKPYSSMKIWVYYESGVVRLSNLLHALVVIKDAGGKRRSIRVPVPRHIEQIKLIYL